MDQFSSMPTPDALRQGDGSDYLRCAPLWRPAVGLFRNMRFRPKAMLIAAAFMAPILLLGYSDFQGRVATVDATAAERDGVAFTRTLLPAIKHARQLRRFTLNEATGASAGGDAASMRQTLAGDIERVKEADALFGGAFGTHEAVGKLDAALKAALPASAGLMPVFSTHGKLSMALLDTLVKVADGSGLTLDPELDTYYTMDGVINEAPMLLEQTARMRVLASATARSGQGAAVAAIELAHEDGLIDFLAANLRTDMDKVAGAHPEHAAALEVASLMKSIDTLRDMASDDLAGGGADKAKAIDKAGAAIVERLEALQASGLDILDGLLARRIAATHRHMALTAGFIGVFILLAGYLFYAFSIAMGLGLREVRRHLKAVTAGDLSTQPRPNGKDETAFLLRVLVEMQAALKGIVSEVRAGADSIAGAGAQIAAGADELSDRTSSAAANVEKSASAMEQIASTVKNTAHHAQDATRLATDNAEAATRGREVIGQMISTMEEIHRSSSKIRDIIGVIDGIAFQTNILALNAAVEAARAGESGRGFAVVASEVRLLAQRSAGAAQEIKTLITDSVEKVESGASIVRDAGDSMAEIAHGSEKVQQLLGQIATGASEQKLGIDQVGGSMTELDRAAHQNAALVEETASAAAALRELAQALSTRVAAFRLPA